MNDFTRNFRAIPKPQLGIVATVCLGLSIAQTGWASPPFPAEIQAHLALSKAPDCLICHTTEAGGMGTATTKFAAAMKQAGLQVENIPSLAAALDTLAANNTDSNADGISDIQALKDGMDPNGATATGEKFGCGGRIATGGVHRNTVVTFAMVCLGLLLMSRRRPR